MKQKFIMNYKKKGVSPLLATILLISIAMLLMGIVWIWSESFIKTHTQTITDKSTDEINCQYGGLFIRTCTYNASTGINLTIENSGSTKFTDNFNIKIQDNLDLMAEGIISQDLNAGNAMQIDVNDISDGNDFLNLNAPLKTVRVVPQDCPTKFAEYTGCTN